MGMRSDHGVDKSGYAEIKRHHGVDSSGYTIILDTQTSMRVNNSSRENTVETNIRVDSSRRNNIDSRNEVFEDSKNNATIDSSILDTSTILDSRLENSENRTRMDNAPSVATAVSNPTYFASNLTQSDPSSNTENPADVNFSRLTPFPLLESSPLCRKASAPNTSSPGQTDTRKLSSQSTQSLSEQAYDVASRKQDSLRQKNGTQDSTNLSPQHDSLGRKVSHQHYWKSSETLSRKNSGNQDWKFPSVNYNYYHSKLNVLNAAEHLQAKYKTRRNSYDLIREKCLTILNMDRKRHEEAYQVSKIITIFDNVGKKPSYGGKNSQNSGRNGASDVTKRGKEKKEKNNEELKQERGKYGEKKVGNEKGRGERIGLDRECKRDGRETGRNGEKVGLASPKPVRRIHTPKDIFEEQETQTRKSSEKANIDPAGTNETYQLKSQSEHKKEVSDSDNAAKQAKILSGKNGDRAKIEKVIENIRIQHEQMMEDMKRKIYEQGNILGGDKDIKTSDRNMGIHHGSIRSQDQFGNEKSVQCHKEGDAIQTQKERLSEVEKEKLSKNIIKTEATIEHTERNIQDGTKGNRQQLERRRTTSHQKKSYVDQTDKNNQPSKHQTSSEFDYIAHSNEKIIKMLDSSHFVITKESDGIHGQTEETLSKISSSKEIETSGRKGGDVSNLEQEKEQEINEQVEVRHKELMDKYQQYEIERSEKELVKRYKTVPDIRENKTNEATTNEKHGILKNQQIAGMKTSGIFLETQTTTTTNGKFPLLFEKIEEEIVDVVENKEITTGNVSGSVDKNGIKFIQETYGDKNQERNIHRNIVENKRGSRTERNDRSKETVKDSTRNQCTGGEPIDKSGLQTINTNERTKNKDIIEQSRVSGNTQKSVDYWQLQQPEKQQQTLYEKIHQQNQQLLQQAGIHEQYQTNPTNQSKQKLDQQNGKKAEENQQGSREKQSLQQQQYEKQKLSLQTLPKHTFDQQKTIPGFIPEPGQPYSTNKGNVRTSVIPFSTSDAAGQQYSAKAGGTRTSASTITKLSKSSIQEDMLEIWLDHQKFLQRHPEDDSFYSFLFVFFAVFASFVFVLIVYFVMFVV